MTATQLHEAKTWFEQYVGTFAAAGGDLHSFLQMKAGHSKRVAVNMRLLAEEQGWIPEDVNMAEALGWLHDVGRFSQFSEFGTFTDATSVNHGERGRECVRASAILVDLSTGEQAVLLDGIRYHNAKTIPDHLGEKNLRFLKLIRDANKLDIFKVVLDSVQRDGFQDLPRMLPQVVLTGPACPHIVSEIQRKQSCSITEVHSLTDYLLIQLSWVYDLNYPASFVQLIKCGIINQLEEALPDVQPIRKIIEETRRFAEQQEPGNAEAATDEAMRRTA